MNCYDLKIWFVIFPLFFDFKNLLILKNQDKKQLEGQSSLNCTIFFFFSLNITEAIQTILQEELMSVTFGKIEIVYLKEKKDLCKRALLLSMISSTIVYWSESKWPSRNMEQVKWLAMHACTSLLINSKFLLLQFLHTEW